MNWDTLHSYAYSPYSGRPSVCVVKGASDLIYPGVLIENLSYPLTITAEQAAITSCLSEEDIPAEIIYPSSPPAEPLVWRSEFNLRSSIDHSFPEGNRFNAVKQMNGSELEHLVQLKSKAVIPNSSFPVSALLTTEDGIIEGVNVEFTNWNLGLCAERVAIAKALSAGVQNFHKLCIHAANSDFASPCGGCRQVVSEWMYQQPIELYHGNGTFSSFPAREFMPYAFKASALNKTEQKKNNE